jgi:hypothetical protein
MKAGDLFTKPENFKLLLLYSGYDEYYTMPEIAKILKIPLAELRKKIAYWTENYPQIMNKITEDRKCIGRAISRTAAKARRAVQLDDYLFGN